MVFHHRRCHHHVHHLSDGGGQESDSSFVDVISRQAFFAGEDDCEEEIGSGRVQINRKLDFPAHLDAVVRAEANPLQARHVQVSLDHRAQLQQVVLALWRGKR